MFRLFHKSAEAPQRPPADPESRARWIDALREAGPDLHRVTGPENGACTSSEWIGAVVSLSGGDPRFPALADAISDGLFGPECQNALELYVPRRHAAEAMLCTRLAVEGMRRRRDGNAANEEFLDDDPAAEDRREFEKAYSAARLAERNGEKAATLAACRMARRLLERDLFGEYQDIVANTLDARIRKLEADIDAPDKQSKRGRE